MPATFDRNDQEEDQPPGSEGQVQASGGRRQPVAVTKHPSASRNQPSAPQQIRSLKSMKDAGEAT